MAAKVNTSSTGRYMASVDSLVGVVLHDDGVRMVTVFDAWITDIEPHGLIRLNSVIDCHNGRTGRDTAGYVHADMTGSAYREATDGALHQRVQSKVRQWVWELSDDDDDEPWCWVDVSELIPTDPSG